MKLNTLREMQKTGALKVEHDSNTSIGSVGGVQVDMEQARNLAEQIGWVEMHLNPFELIEKTNKFMKPLIKNLERPDIWELGDIQFQNRRSNTYGKTFDRIVISSSNCSYTIVYGMENNGGKYVVYETGRALPIAKCRNVKAVAEYLNNNN